MRTNIAQNFHILFQSHTQHRAGNMSTSPTWPSKNFTFFWTISQTVACHNVDHQGLASESSAIQLPSFYMPGTLSRRPPIVLLTFRFPSGNAA